MPSSPLGKLLVQNHDAVLEIAAQHHATNVKVFGSVARGEDDDRSDIDLLADFIGTNPLDPIAMAREVEDLLGVPVDVGGRVAPAATRGSTTRSHFTVTRKATARLEDIVEAISAISSHLTRGDLEDGLIFDAVRVRVIEVGQAVKHIDANLLVLEPDVPCSDIARMRGHCHSRISGSS